MILVTRRLEDNKQGLGHGLHKKVFSRPVNEHFSHPVQQGLLAIVTRKVADLLKETYLIDSNCHVIFLRYNTIHFDKLYLQALKS